MKKIFVYGGCVSRDVFNPEYNSGNIQLGEYIARYSLAKLADEPTRLEIDNDKITSAFQRKLLKNDSENNLLKYIDRSNADFFLMDCLFLKYKLAFYNNTWLTYSSELKRTGIIRSTHKMISYENDLFWDKFKQGLDRLFEYMEVNNKLKTVYINKLYLAQIDSSEEVFKNQEYIESQNECLDKAYNILKGYLKPEQFLSYDQDLFIANPDHRWGKDPMHFIDEFYITSYNKLSNL